MKASEQSNLTFQLIGIILLFCVGLSLFPIGYIAYEVQIRSSRPHLAYANRFQANLTVLNPMAGDSLGHCSDIYIYEWSVDPTAVLFLHIKDNLRNETVVIIPMSHTFNTSGNGYDYRIASISVSLPNSLYSVEAHRFTNNTFFECRIVAYDIYPASPPSPTILYVFWFIGSLMLIAGVVMLHRFIRRIKNLLWDTNTDKS